MLHCGGEGHPIHYISDYKMTVLARYDKDELGRTVIETFWAGDLTSMLVQSLSHLL